jgi:hypothetical protein
MPVLYPGYAFDSVSSDFELIAHQLQPAPHRIADLGLVVDNQYTRCHVRLSPRALVGHSPHRFPPPARLRLS